MKKWLADFFLGPMCPSDLGHRVKFSLVTNHYGNTYCFHRDCIKANFDDVRKHAPKRRLYREHTGVEK